jgi:Flp pilus assembly protein TadG
MNMPLKQQPQEQQHRSLRGGRDEVRRRGATFVYCAILMLVLTACASLAVDLGRVQLAKTELQQAADAAARYGALSLDNIIEGESAAKANAISAAGANRADGQAVTLHATEDIQYVVWNPTSRTYTVTSDPDAANALRVTARRTAARGNAVPLLFAKVLGRPTCNVSATSIARLYPGQSERVTVNATSNPFLAGMPNGSSASNDNPHDSPDYAPSESPRQTSIAVTPNKAMTFDGINGGANNYETSTRYTADGNTSNIVTNSAGSENGIANMVGAPINSLVGVFLSGSSPTSGSTPSRLDFTTPEQRNFDMLQPQLKQIFFIGDGRNADGEIQQFVPPPGATRLFIGTWDAYEWNNNVGSFSVTIHNTGTVTLVR